MKEKLDDTTLIVNENTFLLKVFFIMVMSHIVAHYIIYLLN